MNVIDDADGPLDPRIQIELENLNNATDNINKLEIELDEAHTAFRQLLSESTRRLKEIANKVGGNCIEKARCYYKASEVAEEARVQCQQQAQLFQRASEMHAAAKETVALAEARFVSHQHEWNFDEAWQDTLSHATIKVMDAENQKAACAREHHRRAMLFDDAEKKVQELEEKHRRAINKARPYFEMRSQCDQMMATQKERVEYLQKKVKEAKNAYAASLRVLEEISNQIHERRRDYDIVANGPREPGVGAELITPEDSLNYEAELNKVTISRMNSITSSDLDMGDRDHDFDDVLELKHRVENLGGRSVDGMESTSSQWELELQASMKKLNEIPDMLNSDSKTLSGLSSIEIENKQETDKLTKNNQNDIVKQCVDSQPGKFSLSNYQGWQSLTQSPINSIFSKSKDALKNSISKSLSNSPVNMKQFSFSRARFDRTQSNEKTTTAEKEEKESQNNSKSQNSDNFNGISSSSLETTRSSIIDGTDNSQDNQKNSPTEQVKSHDLSCKLSVDSNTVNFVEHNTVNTVDSNSVDTVDSNTVNSVDSNTANSVNSLNSSKVDSVNLNTEKKLQQSDVEKVQKGQVLDKNFTTHSLSSSPVKRNSLFSSKSTKSLDTTGETLVQNRDFKKPNCPSSKELPLLSIFRNTLSMSKDKSCSMIDLGDKQNLKSLFENSSNKNLQTVSVERLANARHKLMSSENCDLKTGTQ